MSYLGSDIEATLLLCDSADVANGKLYIQGGGWGAMFTTDPQVSLTLASVVSVPWQLTNRDLRIAIRLLNEDGGIVENTEGEPVQASGTLQVGRPPNVRPGISQNVPFVMPLQPIPLAAGGYVFVLSIDDRDLARAKFQILRREEQVGEG